MGYARYIGRVGALAVALGIGSAVTVPGVAWAEPADGSTTSASGTTPATGAADSESGAPAAATATAPTVDPTPSSPDTDSSPGAKSDADDQPDSSKDAATSPSQSTTDLGGGVVISSSGGAHSGSDTADTDRHDDAAAPVSGATTPAPTTDPAPTATPKPASPTPATTEPDHGSDYTPAVQAPQRSAPVDSAVSVPPAEQKPAATAPVAQPLPQSSLSATAPTSAEATPAEIVTAPARTSAAVDETPSTESVVEKVVSAVLGPLAESGTDVPIASPFVWALLAAARRQFESDAASLTADNLLRAGDETGEDEKPVAFAAMFAALADPTAQLATTSTVGTGTNPSGVAVSGGRAYVTNQGAGSVSVYDTSNNNLLATISVGAAPSAVAVNPAGTRAYVSNKTAGTVSVIDLTTNAVTATVKVGTTPSDVTVSPDGTRVFVTNAGSGTVSKIDTTTNKVTVTIKVGNGPSSIAISPDAKYAYVTNTTDNTVSVITLSYNAVKTITGVGNSPTDVLVSPDSTKAYVATLAGSVAVINTATNTITGHLSVGNPTNSIALSADGTTLFAANTNDTLTAIDTTTGATLSTLTTDPTPDAASLPVLALSADGTHLYLTDNTDNALRVVAYSVAAPVNEPPQVGDPIIGTPDTGSGAVVVTVVASDPNGDTLTYTVTAGPASGEVTAGANGSFTYTPTAAARQLAAATPGPDADSFTVTVGDGQASVDVVVGVLISPTPSSGPQLTNTSTVGTGTNPSGVAVSGSRAYVTNQGAGSVSVYDTSNNNLLATISVGAAPSAVAVNPAGTRAYVSNKTAGTVSVIDLTTNAVTATVKVGTTPSDVTVSPDGTRVFVTNAGSGTVSKIDTTTNKVTVTIKVGNGPSSIAISPDAKYAYVTNTTDNTVSVITLSYNAVKTITGVGNSPTDVLVSPDSTKAYVATLAGSVAVINTATNTITGHLSVGNPTNSIALSADGTTLFAANTNDTLTAIDTLTGATLATLTTDPTPDTTSLPSLAISADGTHLYLTDNTDNALRVVVYSVAEPPVNHAPVAGTTTIGVPDVADGKLSGAIGFTDPDGDTLTFSGTTTTAKGAVVVHADGSFTYSPTDQARHNAAIDPVETTRTTDTFTLTASDGRGGTTAVQVTVPVSPRNAAPTDPTFTTGTPDALTGAVAGSASATDTDGDTLTYAVAGNPDPAKGSVVVNPDGTFVYTPTPAARHSAAANGATTDSFYISAGDGHGTGVLLEVTVPVTPANAAPTFVSAAATADPATGIASGSVIFTDPDGDALTYSGTADSAKGHLTVNSDGTFTYTPTAAARHAAATGAEADLQDTFTITVDDAHGATPTTSLTLTITPQNSAPTVGAGSALTTIALGSDDRAKIVFSPDNSHAYTILTHYDPDADSYSYSLATINTATNAVTSIALSGYVDQNSLTVSPDNGHVYVISATDGSASTDYSLTSVDTATNTVTNILLPGNPYNAPANLTVSPDSSHVYLTTYDTTARRYLANIVDSATNSVISVPLPTSAGEPHFSADGSQVYLHTSGDFRIGYQQTLWQIDTDSGAVNSLDWPSYPQSLTFSADGSHAYATFVSNSNFRLQVIDTATLAVTEIPIPALSRAMVVSTDNRYVYATGSDSTLMVVDTATSAVTAIPLGGNVLLENLLAVTPDGKTAYTITGSGQYANYQYEDHSLAIIDLTTNTVTAIPLASLPNQLAISPDGTYAYLNNNDPATGQGAVLLIDTATNTVTNVAVDRSVLSWLTVSPDSRHLYDLGVVDSPDGPFVTLTAIDPITKAATATVLPGNLETIAFGPDLLYAWTHDDDYNYSVIAVSLPPNGSGITIGVPDAATGVVMGALNATDSDGDTLSYTVTGDPATGTVNVNADGTFTYTPSGTPTATTDTFTVTVTDGHGGITPITVTVTVDAQNDAPVDLNYAVGEPDSATGAITGLMTATDPDGDTVTYSGTADSAKGHLTVNPDGTFTYIPTQEARHNATADGAPASDRFDTFTVAANDAHGGTETTSLTFTIVPKNASPTLALSGPGQPDDTGAVTYTAAFTDPDGDAPIYTVGTPLHGTVDNPGDGTFTYHPDTAYYAAQTGTATDTFTVTASDGHGDAGAQSATYTQTNQSPVVSTITFDGEGWGSIDPLFTTDLTHVANVAYLYNPSTGSETPTVTVIETTTGATTTTTFDHFDFFGIESLVQLSADLTHAAQTTRTYSPETGSYTTTVRIIGTVNGATNTTTIDGKPVGSVRLSADGTFAAQTTSTYHPDTNTYTTTVTVIDTSTGAANTTTIDGSPLMVGSLEDFGAQLSANGTHAAQTTSTYNPDTNTYTTTVTVIDTSTGATNTTTIDGQPGWGAHLNADGTRVAQTTATLTYNTVDNDPHVTTTVTVIDTSTGATTATTIDGGPLSGVQLNADGTRAAQTTKLDAFSNNFPTTVTVIDTTTGATTTITGRVQLSADLTRAARTTRTYDPSNHTYSTTLTVIDTSTGATTTITGIVDSAVLVDQMQLSADGTHATQTTYGSFNPDTNTYTTVVVTIVDTTTGTITAVNVDSGGGDPGQVQLSADGTRAVQVIYKYNPDTGGVIVTLIVIDPTAGIQV